MMGWASGWFGGSAHTHTDKIALGAFGVFVLAAFPLILFWLGEYRWFFRDDFEFLTNSDSHWPDMVSPHSGSHWVAVPRLAYWAMWQVAGMRSYVPYQAMVVTLHLAACVLLVIVMRRSGVGAPLAAAGGAALVLFGPGAQNILWAFQISMVGSLTFGFLHLLLADHDGPPSIRDVLGVACGVVGLMCSGISIAMVGLVGLAMLLRHGWLRATLQVVPLATVFLIWASVADPSTSSAFGNPTASALIAWVWATVTGTFAAIGGGPVMGALIAVVTAVGLIIVLAPSGPTSRRDRVRYIGLPVAMFVGSLAVAALAGFGRWFYTEEFARSSRYLHIGAALTLPLIAVAAQALADRWRILGPVFVAMLLVPIPFGLDRFEKPPFGGNYMAQRKRILTTAVRMPFAYEVPADVQPVPDPYAGSGVNMGFLLTAHRNGDLIASTSPVTDAMLNEFRVRLGVVTRPSSEQPKRCELYRGMRKLAPEKGEQLWFDAPVQLAIRDGDNQVGPWVYVEATGRGNATTIELPTLQLFIRPKPGIEEYQVCGF